jgi:hypothetical protein
MFRLCDSILFSTELQPLRDFASPDDWWYFSPEHGQHIAFYTEKSLTFIAEKFGAKLHSNGTTLHLLTRNTNVVDPFSTIPPYPQLSRTLIQKDHEMIRQILRSRESFSHP